MREFYFKKYENKKMEIGICIFNFKKYFYKKFLENDSYNKEIIGYDLLKNNYNIPKRIRYDDGIVIYEYKKELMSNTLHENLNFSNNSINIEKILDQYKNNLRNRKEILEINSNNINFFQNRINMFLKLNETKYIDYIFYMNNNKYLLNEIIDEIKNKILESKTVLCFLTQGDPTDTNICSSGVFTDFENAGYNSIISELAIFFTSLSTHGNYIYPKYNGNVYKIRPKILKKIKTYKDKISYKIEDNKIYLKLNYSLDKRFKKVIKDYIMMIKKTLNDKEIKKIEKYLKYYICFRLFTPININKMEEKDCLYIIGLCIFYIENFNSLDDVMEVLI